MYRHQIINQGGKYIKYRIKNIIVIKIIQIIKMPKK